MKNRTIGLAGLWIFAALLFTWAGPGIADNHADPGEDAIDEETLKIYKRGIRLVNKTAHGRFILAGEVVDQDGNRLKDVEVHLRMSQLIGMGWDMKSTYESSVAQDGLFQVDVRPYTGVNLTFKKEGYYTEQQYFNFDMIDISREHQEAIMSGKDVKIEEGVVRDENIRIVLEKKGNITSLAEEDFKLIYLRQQDGTASGRVADLDRKKWELPPDDRYLYSIPVTNLLDPEVIPPMCVYMIPKIDDDGRILSEEKISGKYGQHKRNYPNELRLITSDPEGGFIIYKQQPNEYVYWSMKLAPETGYKQELVLDADWFHERSQVQNTPGTFFYYKVNGRYGKGSIGVPKFPEGDYALELKTEFQLQVDGSRNLDTGRD